MGLGAQTAPARTRPLSPEWKSHVALPSRSPAASGVSLRPGLTASCASLTSQRAPTRRRAWRASCPSARPSPSSGSSARSWRAAGCSRPRRTSRRGGGGTRHSSGRSRRGGFQALSYDAAARPRLCRLPGGVRPGLTLARNPLLQNTRGQCAAAAAAAGPAAAALSEQVDYLISCHWNAAAGSLWLQAVRSPPPHTVESSRQSISPPSSRDKLAVFRRLCR